MPAQTHCAGKNRRQKRLPRCLFAGECGKQSVVFPFGGLPWGQHRMDGDRWRRAWAQRRRRCVQYTTAERVCKGFSAPCASVLPFVGAFFSTAQAQACQPGFAPQGDFLPDEKVTKESPKAGPSPALWNPPRGTGCTCVLLASALGLVGSHRWCGTSTESTCFSGRQCFYRQGLTLVGRCSQRSVAWLPAAGTPLFQSRPGGGNHPAIGPAAQGSLVWWHG